MRNVCVQYERNLPNGFQSSALEMKREQTDYGHGWTFEATQILPPLPPQLRRRGIKTDDNCNYKYFKVKMEIQQIKLQIIRWK